MSGPTRDVHLAGAPLERYHVCAFFHTPEEEYQIMLPFIREGIAQAEKVFQIIDPARQTELLRRLEQTGADPAALQQSGQLEVRVWEDAYLRGGRFDMTGWLARADETFASYKAQG